ncbi:uncharacterized protein [Temnothorax longispinosus]|uniref:uncharacterized protein isoform X15 n=1 Tax=Temnothorax longispinosus TaxID=300112 RepID=UPI003A98DE9E
MDVEEGEAKMCRLCGQYEKIYIDVFGEEGVRRYLGTKIHEKINILIHKDDPLPQQICASCVDKLDFVCDFYDSCHVIQERLWWLIESSKNQRQEIQKQPADYQTNKGDDPTQEGVTLGTEYSKEYSNIIIKEECLPDLNLELYPSNQETQEQPASYQTNKGDDPMQEGVTLGTEYSTEHLNIIIKEECLPDLNLELYSSKNSVSHLESKFTCPKCPNMYKRKESLNEHLLKHEDIKKDFPCDTCGEIFHSRVRMRVHMQRHKSNSVACEICRRYLSSKEALEKHRKTVHFHDYVCDICHKKMKCKRMLRAHIISHLESKFTCPKCPNVYKSKQSLNEHLLKHESIKKHPIQQIPQNNLQQNNAQSLQRDNMPRRTDVKPRGRMTAYTYFVKSCHQEHKKKHPKRKIFPQFFSKNCGKRWKTMSDIEKKRFHEMAEKDKKRYDTEMQNYTPPKGKNKDIEKKRFHEMAEKNKKRYDTEMQNHTPKGENKGRGKKRKHIKDHNAPKRSLSAFFWFCNDERGKVKMLNPEYGMGDIAKELGKKWSNADPETISKYVAMAEKDKARYERERRNAYKKKIQNNGAPVVETITISDSEWEEWEDVEDDDE